MNLNRSASGSPLASLRPVMYSRSPCVRPTGALPWLISRRLPGVLSAAHERAAWTLNPLRLIPRRRLPRNAWGDREFCRRRFVSRQGRQPDPEGAGRLTDLFYRVKTDGSLLDPLYQLVTDKELAKLYIESTVGPGYAPETYRVLRSPDEIGAFVPDRVPCVLKPTHMSGPVLFHTDPDKAIDRDLLRKWFKKDHYRGTREGNYRHLRPKIIVEEFFSEDGVSVPKDYKLFCLGIIYLPE
ncbi:MAG: hypothetical protein F4X35_04470 [Alphaproteobacteria bacterium]|nr:hypothetical protein [Alphaproteobacteria bacterium]